MNGIAARAAPTRSIQRIVAALLAASCFAALAARAADQAPIGNLQGPGFQPDEEVQAPGFQPRLDAAEIYIDNIDLAGPGASKDSAFITQVRPGFHYYEDRPRFQALADYEFQYSYFSGGADRNQGYHRLFADANGEIVQDLFYLRADAGADQVVANPGQPSSLDTIVNTNGNLVNGYSGSLTPYFQHHFGDTVADLSYTRGFVTYRGAQNAGFGDANITGSDNQRIQASWGTSNPDLTRFSWKVEFDRQEADYGSAVPVFRYEEALATFRYGITRSLRLIAEGGSETDLSKVPPSGQLNTGFYQGGFEYLLGHANEIRLLAGHRFYGTSYDALYRFTGRLLQFESTYTEGPTTESQELFIRPLAGGGVAQPVVTPVLVGGDLATLNSEVFIRKYSNTRLRLRGRRTAIELSLDVYRRNYPTDAPKDDRSIQALVGIIRNLNSRDRVSLSYGYRRYELLRQAYDLRETAYRLQYLRQVSRSFSLTGTLGRLEGDGTITRYSANYGMIGISMKF
jgi:uncharacterized protein (PEP-CTERM system associated)